MRYDGMFRVIRLKHLLTPLVIDWQRVEWGPVSEEWRVLYVFGVRLARWRCD